MMTPEMMKKMMETPEEKQRAQLEAYRIIASRANGVGNDICKIKESLDGDLPVISLLSRYEPKQAWFHKDEKLHGVMHGTRVLILQELLARILIKKEGTKLDFEALRWAASTHDVGRTYGFADDMDHGMRSAEWIEINFKDKVSPESFDTLKYIVSWHDANLMETPKMTLELAVLKDADGLDRERAADLDLGMLRHDFSRALLSSVARHLLFHSSWIKYHYPFKSDFQCAMQAGLELGIVKKG